MQNLYRRAAEKLLRRDPRLAPLAPAIRLAAEYVWQAREEYLSWNDPEHVGHGVPETRVMVDAFERLGAKATRTPAYGLYTVAFKHGTYRVEAEKPDWAGFSLQVYDCGCLVARIALPAGARSSTRRAVIFVKPLFAPAPVRPHRGEKPRRT